MKWYKKTVLPIVITALIGSCVGPPDGHKYITLINKSGDSIGCQMHWKGAITEKDTIFQCDLVTDYVIPSDSLIKFESSNAVWEVDFKVIPYIQFLIMDGVFKQYYSAPCDTVRKYVPVLHVYRLTQSDLEKMHWTVVYPPTAAIEDSTVYLP